MDIQPFELFGLDPQKTTLADARRAFYRMSLACHPDKGGKAEEMWLVKTAYEWIKLSLNSVEDHKSSFNAYYDDRRAAYETAAKESKETKEWKDLPKFEEVYLEAVGADPAHFYETCDAHGVSREYAKWLVEPVFRDLIKENLDIVKNEEEFKVQLEKKIAFWAEKVSFKLADDDDKINGDSDDEDPKSGRRELRGTWHSSVPDGYGEWMDESSANREEIPIAPQKAFESGDLIEYKEPSDMVSELPVRGPLIIPKTQDDYTVYKPLQMADYKKAFQPSHIKMEDVVEDPASFDDRLEAIKKARLD